MRRVVLYPLDRIEIDGKALRLGDSRLAAEAVLGAGDLMGNRWYYCQNQLAVEYDSQEKVKFIEFLGGIDGSLRPLLDGVSIFDGEAEEIAALLAEKNGGPPRDLENGHCLCYTAVSVGLFRERTPEDVREMEEEMRAEGIDPESSPDVADEWRMARHWSTIGMGAGGYYE